MRIAICGAHGVGKTTISRILSEKLQLPVLPDIVVDAHKLGFTINENTPTETQLWLTAKQLEHEKITPVFVADKCIFDYHVYAKALSMDEHIISLSEKIAIETHRYDHIFYIRPEFPIEDDGLRSTNVEFQSGVHDVYHQFLIDNNIPFVYLTGSIEERSQQAFAVLQI